MNHCAARTKEVMRLLRNNLVPQEHADHWSMSCARQATCVHDVETGRYLVCRQHQRQFNDAFLAYSNEMKIEVLQRRTRGLNDRQIQLLVNHA